MIAAHSNILPASAAASATGSVDGKRYPKDWLIWQAARMKANGEI